MRNLKCLLAAAFTALMLESPAHAGMQSIWPAKFSHGTPSGAFTWDTITFGTRFDEALPVIFGGLSPWRASVSYGFPSNLSFSGSALSGYNSYTLLGEMAFRFIKFGTESASLAAYTGSGVMLLYAYGPAATDNVFLFNLDYRYSVEAIVSVSPGFGLRGSYTLKSLTSAAGIQMSPPAPAVSASWKGTGNGSEYEIALTYSPAPVTTWFAGYRGGTSQISWIGAGTTTSTFNGWVVGVESHF